MPIVVPPFYEPNRLFTFSTTEGLKVVVSIDSRLSGSPGTAIPVRTADNPLVLSMQSFDEGYSPIITLSAELRFYWDEDTSLGHFLNAAGHSSGYPYFRAAIKIYDPADNLIFDRFFQLSEQDFIEEITDREHVVTLKLYDGLASLKAVTFRSNLDAWLNCQTQDKNMTIFDCIGWCIHQAKFSNNKFWLIDNLDYSETDFDSTKPYLLQMFLNPETFANAEGETQDCFTALESILKDNFLELRPTNKGGWVIIRKSDYCRLPASVACWEITYNPSGMPTINSGADIDSTNLNFHDIVKDGNVGEGGRGHSSPVEQYMVQTVTKPLKVATAIGNYRNIFTTFPNEFMKVGDEVSSVGLVKSYDIECWTFADINTVGTPVTITPVATEYANRFVEKDAEGKDLFEMVHFHNVGVGSASAIARCMVSPDIQMRKGMALKLRWQHTYSPEVTGGIQYMVAIRAFTAGGGRWVQDDGSLGITYNAMSILGSEISGNLKGNWGLSTGAAEPYYEFNFDVLPLPDTYATYTIYLIGQRADYKMKDFRVESEYYYAGQDERRIEGQSSTVSRAAVGGDTISDSLTQFDSPFYDAAGALYFPDIGGTHQLTTWKWRRKGYTTDEGALKSFLHIYALGRLVTDRRFLRRIEAKLYGLYIPETDPVHSTILGFPPEVNVREYFRLFRFIDRPSPEDTRYYSLTSFSNYNLKLATVDLLLNEVYCSTTLLEVDPDSITTTEDFKTLFTGDRTNINRAAMEQREKQLAQGKGWWWLFGPLGWLVWGRKRKIE